MESEAIETTDIKAKVLQSTLSEVATRSKGGAGDEKNSIDATECCVICLETITEACEARPCQHSNFDFICLLSWLEQQSRCPLCKANIGEVRYEFDNAEAKEWKTYVVSEKREVKSSVPRRPLPPRRNWPYYRPHRRRNHDVPAEPVGEIEEVDRRRQIYRDQLYSLHVGSNRMSQYRELTPQLFDIDAGLVSRARMWLRRELKVFEFLHASAVAQQSDNVMTRRRASNAEFLLEYIIAILKTIDIQGSQGQAEDMLQEFLGRENTRLLLHELKSFLRSPYASLKDWDRAVQYDTSAKRLPGSSADGETNSSRPPPKPKQDGETVVRARGDPSRLQYADDEHGRVDSEQQRQLD